MLVVIGTECIGSYKSNDPAITTLKYIRAFTDPSIVLCCPCLCCDSSDPSIVLCCPCLCCDSFLCDNAWSFWVEENLRRLFYCLFAFLWISNHLLHICTCPKPWPAIFNAICRYICCVQRFEVVCPWSMVLSISSQIGLS